MKKWSLFVASVVLLFVLAACRTPAPDGSDPVTPSVTNTTAATAVPSTEPTAPDPDTYPAPQDSYPAPQSDYPAPQDSYPAPQSGYPAPEAGRLDEVMVPSFSGHIVFHSDRNGTLQLYALNPDDETVLLSQGAIEAYEATWSPDCERIAFTQKLSSEDLEIYVADANGTNSQPLLASNRPGTLEWAPAWSPNGEVIAYQTNPAATFNVCFASVNGDELGCLDPTEGDNAHPAWAPDGETLFFASNRDGDWEIFRMAWGSDEPPEQLTQNEGVDFHPRVSPDGRRVVFQSNRAVTHDIYVMDVDGGNEVRLTFTDNQEGDPSWLGNDQILFAAEGQVDWDLYVMNADGSNVARLTIDPSNDRGPTWCAAE